MNISYRQSRSANTLRLLFVLSIVSFTIISLASDAFAQQIEYSPRDVQQMDGPLTAVDILSNGRYCVETAGVDLYSTDSALIEVEPQGTLVAAYLFWSGRYRVNESVPPTAEHILAAGDDTLEISIAPELPGAESLPPAFTVTADKVRYHQVNAEDSTLFWYTYHADVTEYLYSSNPLMLDDTVAQFMVSGLDSDPTLPNNRSEGHGAGLVAVYLGEHCPLSTVTIQYGLDGFYYARSAPYGPNSETVCTEFDGVHEIERPMDVHMFVGGVEAYATGGHRPNRIFYTSGYGEPPSELINNDQIDKAELPYALTEQTPYPLIADEGEFDNFQSEIQIQMSSNYACFQIESPQQEEPAGISAVWMGLVTQVPLPEPSMPMLIASKSQNVTWDYVVSNPGTEPLYNVVLDGGTGVNVYCDAQEEILPAESMWCSAAADYQYYRNVSFVRAQDAASIEPLPSTEILEWLSPNLRANMRAEVLINNAYAHVPPGVFVQAGAELELQVRITNVGDYPLNLLGINMTQLGSVVSTGSEAIIPWDCLDANPIAVNLSRVCTTSIFAESGPAVYDISVQAEPILSAEYVTIPGLVDSVSAYYVGY